MGAAWAFAVAVTATIMLAAASTAKTFTVAGVARFGGTVKMDPNDPNSEGPPVPDPNNPDAGTSDSGPTQQAVDGALAVYQASAKNFDYWQQQLSTLQNDPNANSSDISSASAQADSARAQVSSAAKAYSGVLIQVAQYRQHQAQAAKDPNQQRLWADQAQQAKAHADLYDAEASAYAAKDQATLQLAQQKAATALQNAQTLAAKAQSSTDLQQSQRLLVDAKAAQVPALTQSTIDFHNSEIQRNQAYVQYLASRTNLQNSQGNLADARAALISGPQAQQMLSTTELRQAQANKLDLTNGATLADLQAKAGLSDARIQQIYANIGKSQVLPYSDKGEPTLTVFNPYSGKAYGTPNPSYVNQSLQNINDTNAAINEVQQQIASGQMTPDQGTQLIQNLRQSLQFKTMGVTPDQYWQAQNQQQQQALNTLNNYMGTINRGGDIANQFLQYASRARGLGGINFTPFSTMGQIANNVYGPGVQNAQQILANIKPINNKMDALQAYQQLAQVKQHLSGTAQADQATNAGIGQVTAATAQAGGMGNTPVIPQTGQQPQNYAYPFVDNSMNPGGGMT